MNAQLAIPNDRIAAFCRRWRITELALFGSVLREDFGPESEGPGPFPFRVFRAFVVENESPELDRTFSDMAV